MEYVIDHYLTYPRFETEDDYLNYIGTIDSESTDKILRYINAPTRLEFLSNVALVQNFEGLDVTPNYSVDDEGKAYQPSQLLAVVQTLGCADIECYDSDCDSYFEVTLMCGRSDQVNNEIIPISRHLREAKAKRRQEYQSL